MPSPLEAPIQAVTVYPSQARVTRGGETAVGAGAHDVVFADLPVTLLDDTVRVSGRTGGSAPARIVGVDIARRYHDETPDPKAAELEERLRSLQAEDRALVDADAAEDARASFLITLARRSGRTFAQALSTGDADADRVRGFVDDLGAQLAAVQERRRGLALQRDQLARRITATEQALAGLAGQRRTQRLDVVVSVEADGDTEVELELTYVVPDASWTPTYDARVDGGRVALTWHGLVRQRSGEDWPAVALALSTARPAVSQAVPELKPWYLDVWRPPVPRVEMAMAAPAAAAMDAGAMPQAARQARRAVSAPMEEVEAVGEQGATAVTYRLARPVAVPADGGPHKATITTIDLEAKLDYITVPKLAEEAYLRATVVNSSTHTLLPGNVAVFHAADFVGTSSIKTVAPGEEVELQLGLDDRVRVERELVQRDTGKNLLGGKRQTSVTYEITVENHLPDAAKVSVIDQFPVSRHESIKVRDQQAKPEPAERTDLDVVTWKLDLPPGATQKLQLSFQLEQPRDLTISGWTD